jgi:hypothetical protein
VVSGVVVVRPFPAEGKDRAPKTSDERVIW